MYYLRAVRNRSAFTPAGFDLAKATKQLVDREGGFASVYMVHDEIEADRLAVVFAMLTKPGPEQLDYILIDDNWLNDIGIRVQPEPAGLSHPLLRDAHCELHGLDGEGIREQLATKFNAPGTITKRLSQKLVTELAKTELDTDQTGHAAALIAGRPRWQERINELR